MAYRLALGFVRKDAKNGRHTRSSITMLHSLAGTESYISYSNLNEQAKRVAKILWNFDMRARCGFGCADAHPGLALACLRSLEKGIATVRVGTRG